MRRESGAAEAHDPGVLNRGDDLVGRGGLDIAGFAVVHFLRRSGMWLQVDAGHHASADARCERNSLDDTGGRCVHGDGNEAVRLRYRLSAPDFLTFADHRYRGAAEVLAQRHDEHRRKREPADLQVAGLVLVPGWMRPVPERISAQRFKHYDIAATADRVN